jgi:hypothetical protein
MQVENESNQIAMQTLKGKMSPSARRLTERRMKNQAVKAIVMLNPVSRITEWPERPGVEERGQKK